MPTEAPNAVRWFRARGMTRRCRWVLAGGWLALTWPAIGHAEDAGSKTQARAHFDRGLQLLDSGDLDAAASEFEAANALFPAALAAYDAALAHARMNRPLAAVRLLRAASERSAPAGLRGKISVLLHEQQARLGTLLVRVTDKDGAPVDDAELEAPGYARNELRVGQIAELSPGSITLRAVAEGHPPITRTILVEAGIRQELVLILERNELPPVAVEAHQAPTKPAPPVSSAEAPKSAPVAGRALPTAGIVTVGVGAVIVAASVAVLWHADRGFVQLSPEVDAFNASAVPGGLCGRGSHVSECRSRSEELNQRRSDLNQERVFGFIGLGVGAAAVAAGAVWCLSASHPDPARAAQLPLELVIAPGMSSLSATGSF